MLRHVVLMNFADETTAKDVRTIVDALNTLPARIPALRDYRVGIDVGLAEGNAHFAVVAEFDDVAGYVTYRDDAEHQRIIAELIRPRLASRVAAQYEC
jgi:hypothetical protein